MKISGDKPITELSGALKNGGTGSTAKKGRAGETTEGRKADSVELSSESRQIARLRGAVEESPDFRREKVEAIKREIEDGTYNVPSEKVADRVIISALIDDEGSGN